MAIAFRKQPNAAVDGQSQLEALLAQPSVAARALELRGAICAATPSIAPGVVDAMDQIARHERSVSAAGLVLPDGSRLGTFNGSSGTFATGRALAADLHGADIAYVLTGGSTSGNQIISKLLAARGSRVLVVANAHHSTVLALTGDEVDFLRLEVEYDRTFEAALAPTAARVAGALRLFPGIDAVWITSPSYEGAVADVAAIADVVHGYGAMLIVDAAWGAHFPFHPELPAAPCALGADVAVTSLHKLGGGPQGTAVLAFRSERVAATEVDDARTEVITTSPSMVLLGGADAALREMALNGEAHLHRTFELASELTSRAARALAKLAVFTPRDVAGRDPSRITFATHRYAITGYELGQALARRGIVCEKAGTGAITFLMAMGLPDDAPRRIVEAMRQVLVEDLRPARVPARPHNPFLDMCAAPACTPGLARSLARKLGRRVALEHSAGWIATEMLEVYPPGIPVIVPGFPIARGAVDVIRDALLFRGDVQGAGLKDGEITVISPRELRTRD